MRVILRVEWGSMRARKAFLAPGERLRVGRMERADLVVPHDEEMSGLHFELSWDGARCVLRDLGSVTGTSLNGECVVSGEVGHGEWIQAGDTFFSVYFEGMAPPWDPPGVARPIAPESKARALATLRSEAAPLYAVLDAAREERVTTLLRVSPEREASLYDGDEGENMDDVAPHLVALPPDSWLLERLIEEGWGRGWGIYLSSRRPFDVLRRALRRNLVVRANGADDELLYFRFYDPFALAKVLPTFGPRQKQLLFEETEAYFLEAEGGRLDAIRARDVLGSR